MKSKTEPSVSSIQHSPKHRFSQAFLASLICFPSVSLAQDGIRELREPTDMEKVAPVRAVGIRLGPAAPIDLSLKGKNQLASPESNQPVTLSLRSSPPMIQASPPKPSALVVAAPKTHMAPARSPERLFPKSSFASVAPSQGETQTSQPQTHVPNQASGVSESLSAVEGKRLPEPVKPVIEKPVEPATATAVVASADLPVQPIGGGPAGEMDEAIRFELSSRDTRVIPIDFPVREIIVRNEQVCRAMISNDMVHVVGLSVGESIVEVKPKDGSTSKYFQIKVQSPWQHALGLANLDQLVHTIQPLSPTGILSVQAQADGSVVVRGKVDNQETAKRVMELTRKLILVPVIDKLEIR